jgi:uncharacterized protein (TIGR03083 family)
MTAVISIPQSQSAFDIPYTNPPEAFKLMTVELERFIKLVEQLDDQDWQRPTACTAWTVRDILAHQVGGYASGTSYKEMFRQASARPKAGELPEDAINALQVAERAERTPQELIAELRRVGPTAIQKWAYRFRLAKLFSMPHPVAGRLYFKHLFWVIHSRDTWMHRMDICRACDRHIEQTPGQDRRIVELVVLDAAKQLAALLPGQSIQIDLSGPAGGVWDAGRGPVEAVVKMDALDFNIFVSGRWSYEEAMSRAVIEGDQDLVERGMRRLLVLF